MNQPKLRRHENGNYYIHWTSERRSARVSTGQDSMRGAMLFYADWIAANIDMLFPLPNSSSMLRRLHKARGIR